MKDLDGLGPRILGRKFDSDPWLNIWSQAHSKSSTSSFPDPGGHKGGRAVRGLDEAGEEQVGEPEEETYGDEGYLDLAMIDVSLSSEDEPEVQAARLDLGACSELPTVRCSAAAKTSLPRSC